MYYQWALACRLGAQWASSLFSSCSGRIILWHLWNGT